MEAKANAKTKLSTDQRDESLAAVKTQYTKSMGCHGSLLWAKVQARLGKLWSLSDMERTGGEPDVVECKSGEFVFMDCTPESPAGRRNVCYARQKLDVVNQTRSDPALRDWSGRFTPECVA
jgi:hypothetical protein